MDIIFQETACRCILLVDIVWSNSLVSLQYTSSYFVGGESAILEIILIIVLYLNQGRSQIIFFHGGA